MGDFCEETAALGGDSSWVQCGSVLFSLGSPRQPVSHLPDMVGGSASPTKASGQGCDRSTSRFQRQSI
jgi:hypothetical protein